MPHANHLHGEAQQKAAEYLAGWQRSRAELDNFKKRMQAGLSQQQEQQLRSMVEPLLGLNDNFRAMVAHVPADLRDHPWVSGATHIARQFNDILTSFGVVTLEPLGEAFDPRRHEAIQHVEGSGQASGTVVEVVQAGYQLRETLLRPAKVKVAQ